MQIPPNATKTQIYWALVADGYLPRKAAKESKRIYDARQAITPDTSGRIHAPTLFDTLSYDTTTPLLQITQGTLL